MPKLWRGAAVVAVACSLAAACTGEALAQQTAKPTITLVATSLWKRVTHDLFVQYKAAKGFDQVTIKGTVSGATTGEVAALYSQGFPFKTAAAPVPGQKLTLKPTGSRPISYHFADRPQLATKYTVEILPSSTATTTVAKSQVQIVYVVTKQPAYGIKNNCQRPVCHQTVRIYTEMPASAYGQESRKKWYLYVALNLSRTGIPPPPKWFYVDKNAKVSKVKRVSATNFKVTISFSFAVYNDGYWWNWTFCSKDSQSKDGINLPGSHGCGKNKVSTKITYLG